MAKSKPSIPNALQPWIEARRKHRLSDAQVQMARELGMNPKKPVGLDKHQQERWKQPLPGFIATLYEKRFGKRAPDVVRSLEGMAALQQARKPARKAAKATAAKAAEPKAPESNATG